MEEVVIQQSYPGIESQKGIMINLPFKTFYDSGSGDSIIVATLANSKASYTVE